MIDAEAGSTTAIQASPVSSTVGQAVTFTATATAVCGGTFTSHYFSIDGVVYHGTFTHGAFKGGAEVGTETLSISTLTAGVHNVNYYWGMSGTPCRGVAYSHYTVTAAAPTPTPSPTPTAAPPTASPSQPPSPVADVVPASSPSPLIAYLGVALIVVTVVSGAVLAVSSRR